MLSCNSLASGRQECGRTDAAVLRHLRLSLLFTLMGRLVDQVIPA